MTAPTAETAQGLLQKHWIKEQTTFDSILAYAATDAVEGLIGSTKIDGEQNRGELNEAVGTASHQGSIKLDRGGKFSIQALIKPAAAGTPPDIGPALLKGAFGVETIVGGTSVTYSFSDTVKVPLQGCLNIASELQHIFSGGVITDWEIEAVQNELPKITFNGEFARLGWFYTDQVGVGGIATTDTSLPLDDASRGCGYPGAVIMIGDDYDQAGSSAGYTITAYDDTSGSADFTISPALSGAGEAAAEPITPYVPSSTVGGTAIAAIDCGLTIDSTSLGFTKLSLKGTTGWGLRKGEATTDRASGIIRTGKRMITGELEFWFINTQTGNAPILGRAWEAATVDIALRIGADTSGARMLIDLNKVLPDIPSFDIGQEDVKASMGFTAQQNSAAADEGTIAFT